MSSLRFGRTRVNWRNIAITLIFTLENAMQFTCCFCHKVVGSDDPDSYTLEVRKRGSTSPVALWSHGVCLRNAVPVMAEGETLG